MRSLKQSIAFMALVSLCYISKGQNIPGSIKGKITTLDGKAAEGVSVIIKGTTKAVLSDESGIFVFRKLESGEYDLEVSLVGYEKQLQHVTVATGQTTDVNMSLVISAADLHEVVITTGRGSLSKKESNMIARMPLPNLENPQTYSLVSKETMKEQVIVDGREAVRNATGAAPVTYPAGGFGIISRGFSTGINARNGMETVASRSSVDIGNVERIEVIKGPSGTLFGSSIASFGGVVNLVTKKPFETLKGELSYTAGSYGLNRLTADINTPVNQEKTALLRINTVVNRQNSFLNYGYNNTVLIAPSFLYKVNDRFTLLADAEYYLVNQTRVTYTRVNAAAHFNSPADIPLAYDKSLYLDDANAKTSSSKFFIEGKYQLSPDWVSSTLFSFVSENVSQSYQYYPTWVSDSSVARNALIYGPIFNNYTNLQQNFNGDVRTGFLRHRINVGVNYRFYNGSFNYTSSGTKFIDTVNVKKTFTALSKAKIDQFMLSYGSMIPFSISKQETISAYATDVVNFTDRLSAMLSLRVDRYSYKGVSSTDAYNQTSLAPKLGLVYQVVRNSLSVFGNYMSGFQNNAPATQPDGTTLVLKPMYAYQYEVGIKAEALGNKLAVTASYYNITIDNATRVNATGFSVQDGKQVSKGAELEVTGNPLPGLNIIAGYAYNDNRIVRTTDHTIEGNKAANAPENVVNFWLSYRFQETLFKNIGLGFGDNYVDKNYMTTANTYFIPAYTVLNGTIFYDASKWRLGVKMNNIAGKKYWDLYGAPQALRNIAVNLLVKF